MEAESRKRRDIGILHFARRGQTSPRVRFDYRQIGGRCKTTVRPIAGTGAGRRRTAGGRIRRYNGISSWLQPRPGGNRRARRKPGEPAKSIVKHRPTLIYRRTARAPFTANRCPSTEAARRSLTLRARRLCSFRGDVVASRAATRHTENP